jgi:fatty-acyl-CoA synthase
MLMPGDGSVAPDPGTGRHAARYHGDTRIVSVETGGNEGQTHWGRSRATRRLGAALCAPGQPRRARCGTIASKNRRHLAIDFGTSGVAFVCQTINPWLFPAQLVWFVNHAQDRMLSMDKSFVPLVASLRARFETVEHLVPMARKAGTHAETLPGLEPLPDLGHHRKPKAVFYSDRSTLLHGMASNAADRNGFRAEDVVLPVVSMFHVDARGALGAGAMSGAACVLPGPDLDGASRAPLIAVRAPDTHPQAADILAVLSGDVAGLKVPERVMFVGPPPRNATGTALRRDLPDVRADALGP